MSTALWNHQRGHEPADADFAKPALAIRLAPGEQKLVGNPVPARRCRGQPRSRKALLHDPQLLGIRPPAAATRVNDLEPTDVMTVSKNIHTDTQLWASLLRKAALVGGVPPFDA